MKGLTIAVCLFAASTMVRAQGPLSADLQGKIDAAAREVLAKTGVPSASNTTTPSRVTTNPAFEVCPRFSIDGTPASPRMKYTLSDTRIGSSA